MASDTRFPSRSSRSKDTLASHGEVKQCRHEADIFPVETVLDPRSLCMSAASVAEGIGLMKYVWVAAAVAPLAFAASLAHAQTTVSGGRTTPLVTSTAGDVTIASGGSITLPSTTTAPAAAVTIDSNNSVSNLGAIASTGPSGTSAGGVTSYVSGIHALGGNTGEISNTGSISITETDTSSDSNSDGVTDTENGAKGEYASGAYRAGILIDGAGTFTGVTDTTNNPGSTNPTAIFNASTITVVGENSAGIAVLTSVKGDMIIDGTISVTGGNLVTATGLNNGDVSYGVLTTAQVNGNISFGGTVSAAGGGAVGVAINDGATGAVSVTGTITASGYRNTTPRTSFGLGDIALIEQTPSEVMQGGPAFEIGGTVGGGLNIAAAVAAVAATSTTAATSAVSAGTLLSYGDAPALLIGNGVNATTISGTPVTGDSHSVIIGGSVTGEGVYDNVNSTGVQIGGTYNGVASQPVVIDGGVSVTGTIAATSYGNVATTIPTTMTDGTTGNGSATGFYVGAGATVPHIDVTGSITASSLTNRTTDTPNVTAIEIDTGATRGIAITNNGSIAAEIGATDILSNNVEIAQGGTAGTATAILDNAGAITSITNTNTISAGFTTAAPSDVVTGTANALNLSANTAGVTVTQNPGTITASDGTVTATSPSITGNVLFGSGAAILNLNTGTLTGDTTFGNSSGTSTGNQINIAGGAIMKGGLTVGSGGALAVSVSSGTLDMTNVTGNAITTPTVNVGSTGEVIFSADPSGSETLKNGQFNVSATAGSLTVASGAKVGLNLLSALPGANFTNPDHFVVIVANAADASQLGNFTLGQTPYLYHITTDTTYQADALTLDVTRATAAQLNLNGNQAAAYNAIYNAFISDADVEADLLSKSTETTFKKAYDQFLPDFAGGPFESLAIGQRAIIREQETDPLKLETDQTRGWVQEIGFLSHQGDSDSAGYDAGGFGVAAGMEQASGHGVVGVSGAFLSTEVADAGQDSYGHMAGSVLEAGVYWRSNSSGINANASLNGGYAWFDSQRQFLDTGPNPASISNPDVPATTATVQRTASAQWGGGLISGQVGLNAPIEFGHFYLRPEVSADYIALFEEGYKEHGGGSAFDLTVAPRTSQQASAQVDLVLGATFGDAIKYRPELLIGWRGVVYGGPGATTANFSGGQSFTLNANFQDKGGLLARLGLRAGGQFADFTADAGGEWHGNFDSYDARALARFLF